MNEEFLRAFALGIVFWATLNYLIDVVISKIQRRRLQQFEEKVDRYRRGHR
jgi:hypothetical protein